MERVTWGMAYVGKRSRADELSGVFGGYIGVDGKKVDKIRDKENQDSVKTAVLGESVQQFEFHFFIFGCVFFCWHGFYDRIGVNSTIIKLAVANSKLFVE